MSAYHNKFIAVVQVDGQVLREKEGCVYVPFGTEYSLLMKNLSSRKAMVQVWIDGKDVLGGLSLIIDPGKERSLERFVEDGNLGSGRKFKFTQKTQEIVESRGDRLDDGFIRIQFSFEKQAPITVEHKIVTHHEDYKDYWPWPCPVCPPSWPWPKYDSWTTPLRSAAAYSESSISSSLQNYSREAPVNSEMKFSKGIESCNFMAAAVPAQDEGITVKGTVSNQNFTFVQGFNCDAPEDPIIIRLKGFIGKKSSKVVKEALTVKTKLVCSECGKSNPSTESYCGRCGNSLLA